MVRYYLEGGPKIHLSYLPLLIQNVMINIREVYLGNLVALHPP